MTHYKFTDGTKFRAVGREFTLVDLREHKTQYQDNDAYYGRIRNIMLTKDGKSDIHEWDDAPEVKLGDEIWIDGAKYVVILTAKASDGVQLIRSSTFEMAMDAMKAREA